jgi:hypothetical protein
MNLVEQQRLAFTHVVEGRVVHDAIPQQRIIDGDRPAVAGQVKALMLWGRHDIFFELDETLSWMKALPRMEAHILDGPHFLLETHGDECIALIGAFIRRVEGMRPPVPDGRRPDHSGQAGS